MFSTALQLLHSGQTDHCLAYLCQCLKCLHQVAIDGGKWASGNLLLALSESTDFAHFGGTEKEMVAVHGFQKSIKELERNQLSQDLQEAAEDEELGDDGAHHPRVAAAKGHPKNNKDKEEWKKKKEAEKNKQAPG